MPLKITYKSPPYRDKALTFEDTLEEIRIGRTAGSEVSYPEDMAIVGHDHFAIVRRAGTYKFVINPHHRVYAGGKDLLDGEELASATEVRLGTPDGPRLLLEPSRAGSPTYIATEAHGRSAALPDIARAGARWTHILGAVVAVVILGGAFAYWKLSGQVQPIYANAGAGTDFSTVIAKYQKSVFLVDEVDAAGISRGGATAWVVALPDGRKAFATNAHVGELLAEARRNHYRLLVRSPESSHHEYEIVDATIHPAYAAFTAMLAAADKQASSGMIREVELSPAYDVAILIPDKQDGIPDALPLAGDKALSTLHAGEPIAYVGYPAENLVSFDVNAPTPTSQVGIITSVRTFFLTEEGGPEQLIEHSLPSAGGASGSPIFNRDGQVIALLSGGNNISNKEAGRIPNAALVNFAQRVDLLRDLIEGRAKDELDADRRLWADGVARWSRPPDSISALYAKQFETTEGKLDTFTRAGTTGPADPLFNNRSARTYDFSLAGGKDYLITAYTATKSPLRVVVYNGDDPSSIVDTTVFVADGPLSILEIPSGSQGAVKIAVISEAGPQGHPDVTAVPFKLDVYWPVGKPPAGSGQESGSSPQGGASPPQNPPPRSAPAPSGGEPSGGGEGGGDVGQTP